MIELLLGVTALYIYQTQGVTISSVYFFILTAALVIVSVVDVDYRIIPNAISIPGIWIGLGMAVLMNWLGFEWPVSIWGAFIGSAAGGGSLWSVAKIYEFLTKREGLGFGDVKLMALFGAHVGISGVFTSLFYGSLFGSVIGIVLMIFKGRGSRYPIPFGPFLCIGLLVYAIWGERSLSGPLEIFFGGF